MKRVKTYQRRRMHDTRLTHSGHRASINFGQLLADPSFVVDAFAKKVATGDCQWSNKAQFYTQTLSKHLLRYIYIIIHNYTFTLLNEILINNNANLYIDCQ